jgi:hypothetical protein
MNNGKFFSLLFFSLAFALFLGSVFIYFYVSNLDRNLLRAEPYLDEIVFEDSSLKMLALNYTTRCSSQDVSCKVNSIYRGVVTSKEYFSDIEGQEVIKSPFETLEQNGGDCEDLAILVASLLENLNVTTYLVLTENHAYALACGVDLEKTKEYGQESLKEIYAEKIENETNLEVSLVDGEIFVASVREDELNLKSGELIYFSSGKREGYMNLDYFFDSKDSFNFYVVLSKEEVENFISGKRFNYLPSCSIESGKCGNVPTSSFLFFYNPSNKRISIDSKIKFSYHYDSSKLFVNNSLSFYNIHNETCVVLETTAGKYGFVGLVSDELVGEKLAYNPKTREYFSLS